MGLFDKLSKAAENLAGGLSEAVDGITSGLSGASKVSAEDEIGKTIHDNFVAGGLGMAPPFAFTETCLKQGENQYPYSEIDDITLESMPTSPTLAGVVTVALNNGKSVTLSFAYVQRERLLQAIKYAYEQVILAHGKSLDYKFNLYASDGSRLVMYEQYLDFYHFKSGIQSKNVRTIMNFEDLTIRIEEPQDTLVNVVVLYKDQSFNLSINKTDLGSVQGMVEYLQKAKESCSYKISVPTRAKDTWGSENGTVKSFTLCGQTLEIPSELDTYNLYYLKFKALAQECSELAQNEYHKKIRDLQTFLTFVQDIHNHYRNIVCDKAMEIIVAEGIWTVTRDSFWKDYNFNHRLTIQYVESVLKRMQDVVEGKQAVISGAMSLIPNLEGGGFGLKGAAKGIATATAFNIARDAVEAGVTSSCSKLSAKDQRTIYQQIETELPYLFNVMFIDYWSVISTLAKTLKNNRKDIWFPDGKKANESKNIFQNLSNPNFPQEKALEIIISILGQDPYNVDYHDYIREKFGVTEEVVAINNYFGFYQV